MVQTVEAKPERGETFSKAIAMLKRHRRLTVSELTDSVLIHTNFEERWLSDDIREKIANNRKIEN